MSKTAYYCGIDPAREETMERVSFEIGTTSYTFYMKDLGDRYEFQPWSSNETVVTVNKKVGWIAEGHVSHDVVLKLVRHVRSMNE